MEKIPENHSIYPPQIHPNESGQNSDNNVDPEGVSVEADNMLASVVNGSDHLIQVNIHGHSPVVVAAEQDIDAMIKGVRMESLGKSPAVDLDHLENQMGEIKQGDDGQLVEVSSSSKHSPRRRSSSGNSPKLSQKRPVMIKSDILPWMSNMYKAGVRAIDTTYTEFVDVVNESGHLTQDEKDSLILLAQVTRSENIALLEASLDEQLAKPELSENLNKEITPDKKQTNKYKALSKNVQKEVHQQIRDCANQLAFDASMKLGETQANHPAISELTEFANEFSSRASDLEGVARFQLIHEDPMWNPELVHERPMAIVDKDDKIHKVVSSFQAQGLGGYSSQAPRNRSKEDAVVANFHRSKLEVDGKQVFNATRSAITVEFDQADPNTRAEINNHLVKQVLDSQAQNLIEGMSEEEVRAQIASGKPLKLKSQTVNLLTPDRPRSLAAEKGLFQKVASKITHTLSGAPADDERTLAMENMAAHAHWNGKTSTYTVRVTDQDGTPIDLEVDVEYDLRYFNIPNNVLYEKMPNALTYSAELQAKNNESFSRLTNDYNGVMKGIDDQLNELLAGRGDLGTSPFTSGEEESLDKLEIWAQKKNHLRQQAMGKTIASGDTKSSKQEFEQWQRYADATAKELKHLKALDAEGKLSPEMSKAIALIEQRENLRDLYQDTAELFQSGISKDLKKMDNNRSALATRMIALGEMLEIAEHFGCRSGKDRTGLVDIELKLLFSETAFNSRVPSYREQEHMEGIAEHREQITLESGNVFDLVRANLGAEIGINTSGSASNLLEENPSGEEFKQMTEVSQAFAAMASRPPTRMPVGCGYPHEMDNRFHLSSGTAAA